MISAFWLLSLLMYDLLFFTRNNSAAHVVANLLHHHVKLALSSKDSLVVLHLFILSLDLIQLMGVNSRSFKD